MATKTNQNTRALANVLIERAELWHMFKGNQEIFIAELGTTGKMKRFEDSVHYDKPCEHEGSINIGKGTEIGARVAIGSNVSIGKNVRIGEGAVICDGVTIGSGATIGAAAFLGYSSIANKDSSIGALVRFGRFAVLYEGCRVGDGAQIGYHALVREDVASLGWIPNNHDLQRKTEI